MEIKDVEVEFTDRHVTILLKYGYPFEREEKQLKVFSKRKGSHYLKPVIIICRGIVGI